MEQLGAVVRPASCPRSGPKGPPVTGHGAQQNHHTTQEKPLSSQGLRWQCLPSPQNRGGLPKTGGGAHRWHPGKHHQTDLGGLFRPNLAQCLLQSGCSSPISSPAPSSPVLGGPGGVPGHPAGPQDLPTELSPARPPSPSPGSARACIYLPPIDTPEVPAGLFLQLGPKKGGKRTFKAQKAQNCCRARALKRGFSCGR